MKNRRRNTRKLKDLSDVQYLNNRYSKKEKKRGANVYRGREIIQQNNQRSITELKDMNLQV